MKNLRITVFGKAGCEKCKILNQRLDKLLDQPAWQEFDKVYFDLTTEEGLVAFCQVECANPQRIPGFVVMQRDEASQSYRPLPNPNPGKRDKACGNTRLFQHLGLQTDYSEAGGGVITPKMITAVLSEAKEACA